MRTCFLVFCLSCISLVNAQDLLLLTSQKNGQESSLSSASVLLKQAFSVRDSAPKESLDLATKAFQLSTIGKDDISRAQASILLAELARDEKRIDLSLEHFLVASMIYKQLNELQTQEKNSIESIPLLFKDNKAEKINTLIGKFHSIAQEFGFSESFAKTLIERGALYYKKKRYQDAINQYIHAINYLTGTDPSVQKNLAITYKKMAESYKRIKEREKTADYYKKTLNIFTKLDDKKTWLGR
ncbi:tetratricopeptide repeat protein [Psychromonas sp. KJ10-10]|uniref:tetratricopeptide repeat protein n=1 Tax=Psychromonas sp. KJ10-10 TaxID=3391823 RepID=UPI0039B518B3